MQPAQEKNKTPGQRIAPLTTDRSVSVLFLAGCNREPMDVGALDPRKTALFIARSFLLQAIPSPFISLIVGPVRNNNQRSSSNSTGVYWPSALCGMYFRNLP